MTLRAKAYNVQFDIDPDASFEECNGEPRPLTGAEYAEHAYIRADGSPMLYDEYRAYYGNPDRHVYLWVHVRAQCTCCDQWSTVETLGNIDFMDDSPEVLAVQLGKRYTDADARALPGYLGDVCRELLDIARRSHGPEQGDAS